MKYIEVGNDTKLDYEYVMTHEPGATVFVLERSSANHFRASEIAKAMLYGKASVAGDNASFATDGDVPEFVLSEEVSFVTKKRI